MTKAPAFQFYARDFLIGTAEMELEEIGAYIKLLCHQWDTGSIPKDSKKMGKILGVSSRKSILLFDKISHKFKANGSPDRLVNARMESVRTTQLEYRSKQAEHGKRGAEIKKQRVAIRTPSDNPVRVSKALRSSSPSPKDLEQTPGVTKSVSGQVEVLKDVYRNSVKKCEPDQTRVRFDGNVTKLLRAGRSYDKLLNSIVCYAAEADRDGTEARYRIGGGNFFGRDKLWVQYADKKVEDYPPPGARARPDVPGKVVSPPGKYDNIGKVEYIGGEPKA